MSNKVRCVTLILIILLLPATQIYNDRYTRVTDYSKMASSPEEEEEEGIRQKEVQGSNKEEESG